MTPASTIATTGRASGAKRGWGAACRDLLVLEEAAGFGFGFGFDAGFAPLAALGTETVFEPGFATGAAGAAAASGVDQRRRRCGPKGRRSGNPLLDRW